MPSDSQQVDTQQDRGERNPAPTLGAPLQELAIATGADDGQPKLLSDEQELRRIVDLIPQTIVVLNPDGKAIYANRVTLEYTGLDPRECNPNLHEPCVTASWDFGGFSQTRIQACRIIQQVLDQWRDYKGKAAQTSGGPLLSSNASAFQKLMTHRGLLHIEQVELLHHVLHVDESVATAARPQGTVTRPSVDIKE